MYKDAMTLSSVTCKRVTCCNEKLPFQCFSVLSFRQIHLIRLHNWMENQVLGIQSRIVSKDRKSALTDFKTYLV